MGLENKYNSRWLRDREQAVRDEIDEANSPRYIGPFARHIRESMRLRRRHRAWLAKVIEERGRHDQPVQLPG
jgi:hypothetical protein